MVHFTCDLCGKELPQGAARYVVKTEVFAAHDPAEITEDDLDEDHMDAVGKVLSELEDDLSDPDEVAPARKRLRHDLCPACHHRFLADPLGKDAQKFDFSEN